MTHTLLSTFLKFQEQFDRLTSVALHTWTMRLISVSDSSLCTVITGVTDEEEKPQRDLKNLVISTSEKYSFGTKTLQSSECHAINTLLYVLVK